MWKLLLLAISLMMPGQNTTREYSGPLSLGPYRIDKQVQLGVLLKELGPPAKRSAPFDSYCYRSGDGRAFLRFETHDSGRTVDALFLSDFGNCNHFAVQTTAADLHGWKTPQGIGLGSEEAVVISAYGTPSSENKLDSRVYRLIIRGYREGDAKPSVGNKRLSYTGPEDANLNAVELGIREGKVSWIQLSNSE
jgi:hypothetical protein